MSTNNSLLRGFRALVVDDDVDSVILLKLLLEEQNLEVISAYSTQEALNILSKWSPDILISDLAMPVSDGFSLVQQIRHRFSKIDQRLAKIALTAYVSPGIHSQISQAGFQTLLTKPLEPDTLIQSIQKLVQFT